MKLEHDSRALLHQVIDGESGIEIGDLQTEPWRDRQDFYQYARGNHEDLERQSGFIRCEARKNPNKI
jgi:hypothetical protein